MLQISDASPKEILDKINQRGVLNFEEDIGGDTSDDASADGGSKGEGSLEEEQENDDNENNVV